MCRIERAPKGVKGISLKLQQEQREKQLDQIPDVSALDVPHIKIDKHTEAMLAGMNMQRLPRVSVADDSKRRK